jgi:hypothetical protein
MSGGAAAGHETVFVNQYNNGVLDPNKPMLGPCARGWTHRSQYGTGPAGPDQSPLNFEGGMR